MAVGHQAAAEGRLAAVGLERAAGMRGITTAGLLLTGNNSQGGTLSRYGSAFSRGYRLSRFGVKQRFPARPPSVWPRHSESGCIYTALKAWPRGPYPRRSARNWLKGEKAG